MAERGAGIRACAWRIAARERARIRMCRVAVEEPDCVHARRKGVGRSMHRLGISTRCTRLSRPTRPRAGRPAQSRRAVRSARQGERRRPGRNRVLHDAEEIGERGDRIQPGHRLFDGRAAPTIWLNFHVALPLKTPDAGDQVPYLAGKPIRNTSSISSSTTRSRCSWYSAPTGCTANITKPKALRAQQQTRS